jgi:hypothetical protein
MLLLPLCLGLLALLGRAGALAPVLALIAGLALTPLAALGGNLVGPGVMLLLAMTVAMAEPGRLAREEWRPTLALAVALVLVTPLAALAAMRLAQLPPEGMAGWLLLVAACPPAGTAPLVAGYLGLRIRPVVLAGMLSFLALPLALPAVALACAEATRPEPWRLLQLVSLLAALPCLLGLGLRAWLGERRRRRLLGPMRGLAVLSLIVISLAVTEGLPALLAPGGAWRDALLGLAAVSLLGTGVAALAGLWAGTGLAFAFALAGGVRNVSVLWGATASTLPAEADVALRLAVVWTLLLPSIAWLVFRLVGRVGPGGGAARPPGPAMAARLRHARRGGRSRRRIGINMSGPEPAHPPTCGSVRRRCSSSA